MSSISISNCVTCTYMLSKASLTEHNSCNIYMWLLAVINMCCVCVCVLMLLLKYLQEPILKCLVPGPTALHHLVACYE